LRELLCRRLDRAALPQGPIKVDLTGIDWVICGGESGPRRRPMDLAWARALRDECAAVPIPYFFKQVDKVAAIPVDLQIWEFPVLRQLRQMDRTDT
jgi:hypothetical protein